MNYFLGIDIAKTNHVASLINNNGDVVIRAIKFTNSNEGFSKLLTTIQDKLNDLSNIEVAMEATGHYWLSVYSYLFELGIIRILIAVSLTVTASSARVVFVSIFPT